MLLCVEKKVANKQILGKIVTTTFERNSGEANTSLLKHEFDETIGHSVKHPQGEIPITHILFHIIVELSGALSFLVSDILF